MSVPPHRKWVLFTLFFVSGFCGLLYQVVWVRLAFASFGIITPVISIVISVFMLGLALGSWAGGRLIGVLTRLTGRSAIFFYAFAELVIGMGAFAVPRLFALGQESLLRLGEMNSAPYLAFSAAAIAGSLFPWCVFMGATFPLMMAYMRERNGTNTDSFSYLYVANVLGAAVGALVTATVLVELLGFRHTLWLAGAENFAIAAVALAIGLQSARRPSGQAPELTSAVSTQPGVRLPWVRTILFTTGLSCLAMEVVWNRSFTPVLGSQVYSFASLLVVYLLATWAGSHRYRRDVAHMRVWSVAQLLALLAVTCLLPVVLNDPRLIHGGRARIFWALASIAPLCALLGYLTPRLIDDHAAGDPRLAGRAYALNVLGCIIGPLLASYLLLPRFGANLSLVILAVPFLIFSLLYGRQNTRRLSLVSGALAGGLLLCAVFASVSYENPCALRARDCQIRRDYAATVVSAGEGFGRRLLVNGIGITELTPITKFIADLPMAFHQGRPESVLVICFGMGTTYRSALSWDVKTTVVELVPSVRDAFPFYHADALRVLADPKGRVVIDDGRRFLNRTSDTYDVIVVDPPPPVEAAGSSLLYSKQFNEAVKRHLKPGGIFQTWFPGGEDRIDAAIIKSLVEVFPYVQAYRSVEGWGEHLLASMSPIVEPTPDEMIQRLPGPARDDLAEWTKRGLRADIETVLAGREPLTAEFPQNLASEITDDRPFNEYYLLRRAFWPN